MHRDITAPTTHSIITITTIALCRPHKPKLPKVMCVMFPTPDYFTIYCPNSQEFTFTRSITFGHLQTQSVTAVASGFKDGCGELSPMYTSPMKTIWAVLDKERCRGSSDKCDQYQRDVLAERRCRLYVIVRICILVSVLDSRGLLFDSLSLPCSNPPNLQYDYLMLCITRERVGHTAMTSPVPVVIYSHIDTRHVTSLYEEPRLSVHTLTTNDLTLQLILPNRIFPVINNRVMATRTSVQRNQHTRSGNAATHFCISVPVYSHPVRWSHIQPVPDSATRIPCMRAQGQFHFYRL